MKYYICIYWIFIALSWEISVNLFLVLFYTISEFLKCPVTFYHTLKKNAYKTDTFTVQSLEYKSQYLFSKDQNHVSRD